MKKSTLMKLALSVVAVFVYVGAMAQTYPAVIQTDYVQTGAETTYQTTGYGLRLYVAPDPAYSPSYTGGATGINPSSWWLWSIDNFATAPLKDAQENWIAIPAGSLPAVGSITTYYVKERIGAAGCVDASPINQVITVTGAPSADIIGVGTGTWIDLNADKLTFMMCQENVTDNITVTFTEPSLPGASGFNKYTYGLTQTRTSYNADGTINTTEVSTTPVTPSSAVASMVASPVTYTTANMTYLGGLRTKYEFTLTPSTIGSQISRISQYRANSAAAYAYYTGAVTKVTYWLNLVPTTGPIYHIPNNFNAL